MTEFTIEPLGDSLYAIDVWMEEKPQRLACYLFDGPERVLVEVGPSATLHHLLAALDDMGIDDVATVVLTHIHIDHAGAAGQFARHFPKARIGVQHSGLRHLADPSRLWASATSVFGEEWLLRNWGVMEPIDPERLFVLAEGDRIGLGAGRDLEVLYTPGHARHHLAFYDSTSGGMFVGDAVGLCYPHGHFVQPLTPPPDFDPNLVVEQMHRMAAAEPRFLGFAHFGPNYDVQTALAEAEERLWSWIDFVKTVESLDDDQAAESLEVWTSQRYAADGYNAEQIAIYTDATFWPMQVTGIRRWLASQAQ